MFFVVFFWYFLNLIKDIYPRQTANFIFEAKTWKAFPFKTGIRQYSSTVLLFKNIILDILAYTIEQMEIKDINIEKVKANDTSAHCNYLSIKCKGITEKPMEINNRI